ncbi:MAG TPA: class I SAM-dependent methyltransferase [Micromonosporaceae bacterium]|nr:class I SAM-dependent methyltransferase [Micromonosporaceae bacterium]
MGEPVFDAEGLFDEDYLYFYEPMLSAELSDAQTERIWRLLDLRPGMRVLDLACGHGRIASRLAARGCQVTGLDASPLFLDHARRDAASRGVTVDYVEGDMRTLPWSQHFDRVVSWFTAFGYFDDAANRQVLTEVARVLKPDGRVAFDLMNRDWLIHNFQPDRVAAERDGDLIVDRSRIDVLTSRVITERIVLRAGGVRRVPFFTRLFAFTELRDWLVATGFTDVNGYGQDGTAFSLTSTRMIVTAQR